MAGRSADTATPGTQAPDDFPGKWITISEAVSYFRVSERTIRRRIATGLLPTKHEGGRVLIYLYDTEPDKSNAPASDVAELVRLQAEVRRLSDLLSQAEGERDYLRQALAAALSKIPQIEAQVSSQPGASDPEPDRGESKARWWEFWK